MRSNYSLPTTSLNYYANSDLALSDRTGSKTPDFMTRHVMRFMRDRRHNRTRRPRGWKPLFSGDHHQAGEQRKKRNHLLSATILALGVTTVFFCAGHEGETARLQPLIILPEPAPTKKLSKPPTISGLLPLVHKDGRKRSFPDSHLSPFVYTAVGIPSQINHTSSSKTFLFLYTQGTVACTGEKATACSHLDVASCIVGGDSFPVIYEANGVFTCHITRFLRTGEQLTVTVSTNVWKQKVETGENEVVEEHLKQMRRLDDGSYILPSDVVWENQMDPPISGNEGRYKVCLMTQEKVFADYTTEWLSYHRRIGVDYVYIYDNNSPRLADMYKDAGDVEVVHWPWERSQIQAQNHFLLLGRRRCQWAVLIDVDEYIIIRPALHKKSVDLPLKALLRDMREKRDVSQLRLKSIVMGSSGHKYHPKTPLAESYFHLADKQDNLTKPVVWLGHAMPDSHVHRVEISPGYYSGMTTSYLDKQDEFAPIGLIHLKFRSWEDYVDKGRGGRNSFRVGEWNRSSGWSTHSAPLQYLTAKNVDVFWDLRRAWRRTLGKRILEPQLGSWNEAESRYDRISRKGWVWKKRRAFESTENSSLTFALIEQERAFHPLKDWEIAKRNRLAQWNKKVDFFT